MPRKKTTFPCSCTTLFAAECLLFVLSYGWPAATCALLLDLLLFRAPHARPYRWQGLNSTAIMQLPSGFHVLRLLTLHALEHPLHRSAVRPRHAHVALGRTTSGYLFLLRSGGQYVDRQRHTRCRGMCGASGGDAVTTAEDAARTLRIAFVYMQAGAQSFLHMQYRFETR